MAILSTAIKIAQQVYKNRQTLYKVITAQDKYVGQAWKKGGYGKASVYGVRSGAVLGTIAGSFIKNDADDSPGNGIQKPFTKTKLPSSGKSYQTRRRYTKRDSCWYPSKRNYSRN